VEGADEVPKILDFGVARSARKFDNAAAEDLTVDGMVVGTPGFMSPEQATGQKDIDHRGDLWSLGVLAYYALTGVKPFPGPGTIDTLLQICHQEVRPPSQVVPGLPPEIDAFIARALQKERRLRFQSSMEMARALKPFLPSSLSVPPAPLQPVQPLPPVPGPAPKPIASNADKPTLQPPRPATPPPRNRAILIGIGAASLVLIVIAAAWAFLRKGDTEPPPAAAPNTEVSPSASNLPTMTDPVPSSAAPIPVPPPEPTPSASAASSETAPPATTPSPQPTEDRVRRTEPKTPSTSGPKRRDLGY
jgi:serine/threonine-protein kinase